MFSILNFPTWLFYQLYLTPHIASPTIHLRSSSTQQHKWHPSNTLICCPSKYERWSDSGKRSCDSWTSTVEDLRSGGRSAILRSVPCWDQTEPTIWGMGRESGRSWIHVTRDFSSFYPLSVFGERTRYVKQELWVVNRLFTRIGQNTKELQDSTSHGSMWICVWWSHFA